MTTGRGAGAGADGARPAGLRLPRLRSLRRTAGLRRAAFFLTVFAFFRATFFLPERFFDLAMVPPVGCARRP
jgi:hypothetical protein